ncbi:hypothetical protein [Lactobacillus mulieris]|nr:hypothetical protein [Lactobacillus mulieris]
MSNVLKKYIEEKNISAYQISKESGIPYTTINNALKDGKKLEG